MRPPIGSFLLPCGLLLLLCAPIAAQAVEAPQPKGASAPAAPADDAPLPRLGPGQVALVNGVPITDGEYLRYLGTVYARLPEGELAIQQALTEWVVQRAAEAARVEVSEAEVDELAARLEARAREATDGRAGLEESLGAEHDELRRTLRLLALQEKVVAQESGVEHPSDQQLREWMDGHLEGIHVLAAPLDDPVAARWEDGEISRVDLGRRLHLLLEEDERSGVLTELIGVLLIREAAVEEGIELTPEAVAEELAQRDALVRGHSETAGLSYADIIAQTKKLSLEELIASPAFGAEVLLRLVTERRWTEAQLRQAFEAERQAFALRYGEEITFEEALPMVWREVRQRSYQQLFREGTIIRRF